MRTTFNINDLWVLLVIVIWGGNNALMKLALAEIPLISFVGLRLIAASMILLVLLAVSPKGLRISLPDLARLSLIGFFGYTLFHPMFAAGLHYSTATDCALIMGTGPLFGGMIALSMGIERLTVRIIVGILISLFGVLVIVGKDLSGTLDIATRLGGNLILLAGVVFLSLSTVLGKPLLERHSPFRVTAYSLIAGTVFLLPWIIPPVLNMDYAAISATSWWIMVYCVTIVSVLSFILWYRGVEKIGPTRTMIYQNLIPVTTVCFAVPILSENISLAQVLGAGIAVTGIYISRSG